MVPLCENDKCRHSDLSLRMNICKYDRNLIPSQLRDTHRDHGCFGAGAARGPGSLGVGARCGNGPFSTYKSPKFYLSFTILVSFILVRYPDRIGLVNTVP